MITKELVAYVKAELSKGTPYDTLRAQIIKTGWAPEDFNEAMREIHPEPVSAKPAIATPPVVVAAVQPSISPVVTAQPIIVSPAPVVTQPASMVATPIQTQTPPQTRIIQTPYTPADVSVAQKPPKKKIILISLIVLGLLLIAGAVYGYVGGYFTPLSSVLAQSLEASRNAKTSTFDITVNIDASGLKNSPQQMSIPGLSNTFSLTMKGSSDATDPNNVKIDSTALFSTGSINGALEFRALSNTFYAQLTQAPDLGFFSLAPYENKWFSFAPTDPSDTASNPLASLGSMNPSTFDSLTQDQKDHLYALAANAHFITITKRLPPQKINGTLSYDFTFDIDRAGLKAYLQDATDYIHSIGVNDSALSAFDMTPVDTAIDSIQTFNGEAWIGISDHLPRKFDVTMGIAPDATDPTSILKVTTVALFDNWNQPVSIAAPSDSVPFQTVLSGIFGGAQSSVSSTPTDSPADTSKKSILGNMGAQAKLFYDSNNSSYAGVCNSNTKSAQGLRSDANSLPANTQYKCLATAQAWAASAKLDTGEYYCVDSTGFTGSISKAVTTTACSQ